MRKVFLAVALAAIGCGDNNNNMNDMAMNDMTMGGTDGGGGDMTMFTPTLNGTQLFTGATSHFLDSTTDDYAIVAVGAMAPRMLKAYPMAGGAAMDIDSAYSSHSTVNKGVLSWTGAGAGTVGQLIVWTAANGSKTLTATSASYVASVSTDSTRVIFADNATASTFDLKVAKTDGTGVTASTLTGLANDAQTCAPAFAHAGTTFFVQTCAPGGDAGITAASISSVDETTGAATSLATTADPAGSFSIDTAGAHVFFVDTTGHAQLVTVGTGTTPIDAGNVVTGGFILADGSAVLYQIAGAFKRYAVSGGAISTIAAADVTLLGLAGNESHVMFSNMFDQMAGGDIQLASTGATAGVTELIGSAGFIFGDSFSTDGAFALYFHDLDMDGSGTLTAAPTAGGTSKDVGTVVWDERAGKTSTLVYSDNFTAGPNNTGFADVYVTDLTGSSKTLIATGTDALNDAMIMSASKKYLLYTFNRTKGQEAGYAYQLP